MKDTEIAERFGIPIRTLASWKAAEPKNWRRKLYLFMRDKLERENRAAGGEEHY